MIGGHTNKIRPKYFILYYKPISCFNVNSLLPYTPYRLSLRQFLLLLHLPLMVLQFLQFLRTTVRTKILLDHIKFILQYIAILTV